MKKRISIATLEPEAYKAMMVLENYCKTIEISPILKEIIKIRASILNNCAYCLDMHTEQALKLGETNRRIFAMSVWEESHLFSEEERLALKMTDEITLISKDGLSEAIYNQAISVFGEKTTAQMIMQIVLINAWNRIAIATKMIFK